MAAYMPLRAGCPSPGMLGPDLLLRAGLGLLFVLINLVGLTRVDIFDTGVACCVAGRRQGTRWRPVSRQSSGQGIAALR